MSTYDIGDKRTLSANFQTGAPLADTDPTTLTFKMKEPDGTVTTYVFGTDAELVKDDTGDYHADWTIAKAGRHRWRFIATGGAHGEEPGDFDVRPTNI